VSRIIDQLDRQGTLHPDGQSAELQALRTELRNNHRRTLAVLAALGFAGCATALLIAEPQTPAAPLASTAAAGIMLLASLALLWRARVGR
jgi:hypothetical protein